MRVPVKLFVKDPLIINKVYPNPAGGMDYSFIVDHYSNVIYSSLVIIEKGKITGFGLLQETYKLPLFGLQICVPSKLYTKLPEHHLG